MNSDNEDIHYKRTFKPVSVVVGSMLIWPSVVGETVTGPVIIQKMYLYYFNKENGSKRYWCFEIGKMTKLYITFFGAHQ